MKKAWSIISNILAWTVVILAVLMMIFTIISVNTFNRNDRNILGYRAYIVLSDSMSRTDFNAGDLVLVKQVDPTTLEAGDIIAYRSQNTENYGQTVTHKIREKTTDGNGNMGFVTYGTTTDTNDETIVTYPFVLGKYQFHLPKVGTFFQFLKTPRGYIVCILLPFLMLIGYQGLNVVKVFKLYKQEQLAEIQAEKERIEAERKRSEEMMEQLISMKKAMMAAREPVVPSAPAAPPAAPAPEAPKEAPKDEMEALRAELEALRAQLAAAAGQKDTNA